MVVYSLLPQSVLHTLVLAFTISGLTSCCILQVLSFCMLACSDGDSTTNGNVGALIIRIGFWGFLSIILV